MQKGLGIAAVVVGCIVVSSCGGVKEMISLEGAGDVRPMGGNRWEITTSGNKYVERKDIYNRWDVKAAETCKGPLNVVSRNFETRAKSALVYLVGIVECTSQQKPQNSDAQMKPAPATEVKPTPAVQAEPSSQKMTVQQIQQRLSELGYQPGPADGKMGKGTIEALKKFQQDSNLAKTGQADNETIAKLLQKKR